VLDVAFQISNLRLAGSIPGAPAMLKPCSVFATKPNQPGTLPN